MIEEVLAVYLMHLSYSALVIIPIISSMGFPFSEELVLLGAGYLASTGFIDWNLGLLFFLIVLIEGENTSYIIGRQGGRLFNLIVSERRLRKAKKFFNKWGAKAVFVARFVPGPRFLIPIIAGASKMPWRRFFFYNALGAVIVVPIGMTIGYYIGRSMDQIIGFTQELNILIFVALLILLSLASIFVCIFRKKIRKKVRESNFFDRWLKKGEEPYQMVTFGNPDSSARRIVAKIRKADGKVSFIISYVKAGYVKKFIKLKRWLSLRRYNAFVKKMTKHRKHKVEEWE
ncbi:DedA family protein [Candidatus Woesearchaeota archaeon]|nr:DedA family protein [Candidatus Woesearchaeota archaeon]